MATFITEPNVGKTATLLIFGLLMVSIIVAADISFFRHRFWPRLLFNIGIVLVFIALYWRFFRPS